MIKINKKIFTAALWVITFIYVTYPQFSFAFCLFNCEQKEYLSRAEKLYSLGDTRSAIEVLETSIYKYPEYYETHLLLMKILAERIFNYQEKIHKEGRRMEFMDYMRIKWMIKERDKHLERIKKLPKNQYNKIMNSLEEIYYSELASADINSTDLELSDILPKEFINYIYSKRKDDKDEIESFRFLVKNYIAAYVMRDAYLHNSIEEVSDDILRSSKFSRIGYNSILEYIFSMYRDELLSIISMRKNHYSFYIGKYKEYKKRKGGLYLIQYYYDNIKKDQMVKRWLISTYRDFINDHEKFSRASDFITIAYQNIIKLDSSVAKAIEKNICRGNLRDIRFYYVYKILKKMGAGLFLRNCVVKEYKNRISEISKNSRIKNSDKNDSAVIGARHACDWRFEKYASFIIDEENDRDEKLRIAKEYIKFEFEWYLIYEDSCSENIDSIYSKIVKIDPSYDFDAKTSSMGWFSGYAKRIGRSIKNMIEDGEYVNIINGRERDILNLAKKIREKIYKNKLAPSFYKSIKINKGFYFKINKIGRDLWNVALVNANKKCVINVEMRRGNVVMGVKFGRGSYDVVKNSFGVYDLSQEGCN